MGKWITVSDLPQEWLPPRCRHFGQMTGQNDFSGSVRGDHENDRLSGQARADTVRAADR